MDSRSPCSEAATPPGKRRPESAALTCRQGSGLSHPEFHFELGTFGSFEPTLQNAGLWALNWRIFDASDGYVIDPSDGTAGRFGGSADLQSDQTSSSPDSTGADTFGPNEQTYVWIYDTDTNTPDSEWALYTRMADDSPWIFPSVSGGLSGTPSSWFLSDADSVIIGAINPSGGSSSAIIGAGGFTDTSTDFAIRLHTAHMPEPGSAFLAVTGLTLCLTRRHRA